MIDIAEIKIKAGNGGDGKVSFLREKFKPKGGPDGGDGGNGGSVYLVADNNISTLMDFKSKSFYKAQNGEDGGKYKMTGASGEDLYIKVPMGTLVYEMEGEKETLIGDLVDSKQVLLLSQGGKGGKGNYRFRSSTNITPTEYTLGEQTSEMIVKLEIKMIADIGLIGAPNAGKSTLLNRLTNSKAKVANYPFTTLSPNLGSYILKDGHEIIVADIPGLIEGASEGKGLGDEFLRHIERTRFLIHLIDPMDGTEDLIKNSIKNYKMIRNELKEYKAKLEDKKEILVINKIDVTEVGEVIEDIKDAFTKEGIDVIGISAVTGEGLGEVENKILQLLEVTPKTPPFESRKVVKKYDITNIPNKRMVFDTSRLRKAPKIP